MEFRPAIQFPLSDLGALFTRAFEGYIGGSFTIDATVLSDLMLRDGASLNLSLVALNEAGQPSGFVLIARRGSRTRIAGMGVDKSVQGQGVGRQLMEKALKESEARGDTSIELEVIQQNDRALRLYESLGFTTHQELWGFTAGPLKEAPMAKELREIELLEIARDYAATEDPWLPWQCSSWTLATSTTPSSQAFTGENWKAMTSKTSAETVAIRALAVPREVQRRGIASKALAEIRAALPTKTLKVSAICPQVYAPIFESNGFRKESISQYHMRIGR